MVIEHGSYWLHHHDYIYKLFFVLPAKRLDVREEVEIVEVVKTIVEKPSCVPNKINTRSFIVCIKNEFWSRHSKMFALLQLKEKFEHFQLFPKVFILSVSIKEMDSGLSRTAVTCDILHDIGYSEVRQGEDILCNLHPCNTVTASPKSPVMRRSLSSDSLSTIDPPKPQDSLSMLATPPKKVSTEDILESILTNRSNDPHENCVDVKENNKALRPKLLQRKRNYSYGTGWQPPLKRITLGSEDLCAQEMKLTIIEKKSKSFSSLLTSSELRQRIHYFSDQTQYSYTCKQDNIFRDRTSILALINKYERDINHKPGINFVKNTEKSENNLWVNKTTNVSLDRNKIVDYNSSTDENFCNNYRIDDIFAHCTYKNVRILQNTLKDGNNITPLKENVNVEHCEYINDVSCTNKEILEDKKCTELTVTTESEHSDHSVNEELTIYVSPSSGENEQIQVEEKDCIVSAADEKSVENDKNLSGEITCNEDVCSNIEGITDASNSYQLDKDDRNIFSTLVDVTNSCAEEPSSDEDKMRNNHEMTHVVEPESEVLNSDLNQELCVSSISNTLESNSCVTSSEAIKVKDIEHLAEDSNNLLVNAFESECPRELINTDKKNMSTYLVSSEYNAGASAQTHDRRPRSTGMSPLNTVIKEVVYPRPLDYARVLTRRQFENEVKIFEDKILNVDELLSSNNMLKPELRTRSMKGRTVNLKKLLQDLRSSPTVILYRIDDQYRKY